MNEILVSNIDKGVLARLITAHHYSHACSAVTVGYGVWYNGVLSGGIVFSSGVGRFANAYCRCCTPSEVIELTRLWLADEMPKNSESYVIGVALRVLRKGRGRFRCVASYADEAVGHLGRIYQATNFRYMGDSSSSGAVRVRIGDVVVNTRSLTARYGTSNLDRLKQILGRSDIEKVPIAGRPKHAYMYPLEPEAAAWLDAHKLPYPKHVE